MIVDLGRCKKCGEEITEEDIFDKSYKCPACETLNKKWELLPE